MSSPACSSQPRRIGDRVQPRAKAAISVQRDVLAAGAPADARRAAPAPVLHRFGGRVPARPSPISLMSMSAGAPARRMRHHRAVEPMAEHSRSTSAWRGTAVLSFNSTSGQRAEGAERAGQQRGGRSFRSNRAAAGRWAHRCASTAGALIGQRQQAVGIVERRRRPCGGARAIFAIALNRLTPRLSSSCFTRVVTLDCTWSSRLAARGCFALSRHRPEDL